MSKINPLMKNSSTTVERLAGGFGAKAAKQSNELNLRRAVLANLLWEDIAYMDGMSVAEEIKRLIPLCDPNYVAQIAIEARVMQKLRHTPLFIVSEMCRYKEHNALVGEILPKIITRADMLTDFLAIYWHDDKRKLTNQVKKGLAKSFYNFQEYHYGKYDRDAAIKIRDVMFLVHPKPRNEKEAKLFADIANRTLKTPDTWEVALSRGDDKKLTWERLILERKLGGLAFLRNLANMQKAQVSQTVISQGFENLSANMLLPLDFYKAIKMNKGYSNEINDAMIKSYSQLPKLKGKSLIIIDVSGSMNSNLSGKSMFTRKEAAFAMALLAAQQCEDYEIVVTAGNDSRGIGAHEVLPKQVYGMKLIDAINEANTRVGWGGIFTRQCLEYCQTQFPQEQFERVIVFSDSQDCDRTNSKPKPFGKYNYICDVSCHTKGIKYNGLWTAEISGFSEHFLTYIAAYEGIENLFEIE